ncbi:hypothetical protein [Tahibacter sp.]|uniref:hypothetical protein n=1 Tax=Tahibacter sp. TaxID=2056211 RepID=UPI0028C459A9|nr:hypothetical protein [Tahibacter sp.]
MSNRTFACLDCRKLQRKPSQRAVAVICPHCRQECIVVAWKLHVPAPRKRKKWDAFWKQYLLELRLIQQKRANPHMGSMYLPLLNQYWV